MKVNVLDRQSNIVVGSVIGLLIVLSGTPLFAQEGRQARNWEFMLGAGGIAKPLYSGSDDINVRFLPFIRARYKTQYLDFFLGMNGVGVTLKPLPDNGVKLSAGVGLPQKRKTSEKNGSDVDILEDTPELNNDYHMFGTLEVPLQGFGRLSSAIKYVPVEAAYDQEDIPAEAYDAVLVEAAWSNMWRLHRQIRLSAQIGASWMNDAYAEAFYSIRYPTQQLEMFTAESGIRDIDSSVAVIYTITRNIGLRVFAEGSYLLNDAADSPLTQSTFQPSSGAFIFYTF